MPADVNNASFWSVFFPLSVPVQKKEYLLCNYTLQALGAKFLTDLVDD